MACSGAALGFAGFALGPARRRSFQRPLATQRANLLSVDVEHAPSAPTPL
jgi:hypothetical protein